MDLNPIKLYGSVTLVSGVIDTADHKKFDFIVEYFCEYEAICNKALTRGSMAQMELFDKKTGGRKSRDRVPLSAVQKI
jgi:hypothetical protein